MLPDWRSSGPTELGDLVELAALIDSVGLLQPGLVSDHPGWPVLCALWHSRQDGHVDPEGSIRLLPAILWELPSLPAAACRDHWPDFDDRLPGETPQRRAQRLEAVEGYGLLRRRPGRVPHRSLDSAVVRPRGS